MGRTVIASDNFNRAALGSDWSQRNPNWGTVRITSSTYIDSGSGDSNIKDHGPAAAWVGAGTFTDDQYASIAVSNFSFGGSNNGHGVIARCSTDIDGNRDYYGYFVIDDASGNPANRTLELFKVINGTPTSLVSGVSSIGNGDRVEIECVGTTIRGLVSGILVHSVTDVSLTTGTVGIIASQSGLHGDDWEGGNFTAFTSLSQTLIDDLDHTVYVFFGDW